MKIYTKILIAISGVLLFSQVVCAKVSSFESPDPEQSTPAVRIDMATTTVATSTLDAVASSSLKLKFITLYFRKVVSITSTGVVQSVQPSMNITTRDWSKVDMQKLMNLLFREQEYGRLVSIVFHI